MGSEDAIKEYFDDFVEAFATYSGTRVAGKFSVPYLVRGESGQTKILQSLAEVSHHFQSYLDEYEAMGCRSCRYANLEVKWLGTESVLASVDWMLLDQSEAPVSGWAESYLLSLVGNQVLAYASIDHASSVGGACE